MSNTQGLDALAALCGYTAAAASNEMPAAPAQAGPANDVSATVSMPQQQVAGGAVASLYSQQQQQMHQQQALQLQHAQHVLTMRQAAVAAAQQQQQQQRAASIPSQFIEQAQKQLQNLLAAQQQQQQMQQQQQQQQHQQVNAYGEGFQSFAAQLLAVRQQQNANNVAAAVAAYHHPGLATTLSPAALASFVANAGGATAGGALPGAAKSASSILGLSPSFHSANDNVNQTTPPSTLAMPPPPGKLVPSLPLSNNNSKALKSECSDGGISTRKPSSSRSKLSPITAAPVDDIIMEWEDKKQAKRAANRLSAHLSRKRKKLLIDDLKDENVELRRKEQILRSIPDLIVVFDSSGCISFISHSVIRFMNFNAEELEDTSFWDRLTEDSVRLIKSAFMDALAVKRHSDEDSTPLANGESMTVTLIPKKSKVSEGNAIGGNGQGLLVSLKGVVHFGEEYPECVCSIRPEGFATNKLMSTASKESCSAVEANTESRNRQERGTEHQVSDIDSERS